VIVSSLALTQSQHRVVSQYHPCGYALRYIGLKWLVSLDRNPRFDWCVVQWGSDSKHHNDTCSKEIGLRLWILSSTLHSIVSTIGTSDLVMYSIKMSTNMHYQQLYPTITKLGDVWLSIWFFFLNFKCFIIDLLMENMRMNWIPPIYLRWLVLHVHWATLTPWREGFINTNVPLIQPTWFPWVKIISQKLINSLFVSIIIAIEEK
jgi:hypothetical protein